MRTFGYDIKEKNILFLAIFFVSTMSLLNGAEVAIQKKANESTAAGETRLEKVREMSLEREQKTQEKKAGIDTRPLTEIEEQTTKNTYTQTEAYFQIPALRELVLETFNEASYKPVYHMDIISRVMAKEAQLKGNYWVFYHGTINDWILPQDIFKELNNHFRPEKRAGDDFVFLRFSDQELPQAKEFLEEGIREFGLIDDNGNSKGKLLSTNVSLFGNTAFKGESTWHYFMTPVEHVSFNRANLEDMMTKFAVTHKYIDELMDLLEMLHTKTQTLLQIFIPKDIVDEVGYLSWSTGIPAHAETIDWVRNNVRKKVYKAKFKEEKTAEMVALEDLQNIFKKERERNPLYRDIMQSIEEGDYSLDAFLRVYCNKPWELLNLNYMQARLVLSNEMLLNPHSGIKIFRYSAIKPYMIDAYKKRLHEIIQKIIAEKMEA